MTFYKPALVRRYSIDNLNFAFDCIEDAVSASLSKHIPNDKTVDIYEGTMYDNDTEPFAIRCLRVKVLLNNRLGVLDAECKGVSYVV